MNRLNQAFASFCKLAYVTVFGLTQIFQTVSQLSGGSTMVGKFDATPSLYVYMVFHLLERLPPSSSVHDFTLGVGAG